MPNRKGPLVRYGRDMYWWKKAIQQRLAGVSGGRVMIFETPKHGVVDTDDMARAVGPIGTILDVGANTGQSAIRFRAAFPAARIVSVEPASASFAELLRRTSGLSVECHRIALGPERATATMYITPFSETNSLVKPSDDELLGSEEVQVETLDDFVRANNLDRIDLLKIDAEGFDLEVLRGASATLESKSIRFVMIEVGFQPGDDRHPLFDTTRNMLKPHGFRLFGIYGQTLEWTGEPAVRFANAIFCRQG